jgi:hypothetical protein
MEKNQEEDDGVELVPIPMNRVTRERLVLLAQVIGKRETEIAGEMFHDLMADDELWNEATLERRPQILHS